MDLAKKLFQAEFADVRPISGVVANLIIYSGFTNPGDVMIAPSIPAGGHISHGKKEHSGTAGLVHGLEIEFFAFDCDEMNLDVDKTKTKIQELEKQGRLPKIAMFGGSVFLFPHPVKELADFLKGYNMHINYDAAHVAGLISGGEFQDPLREGVDTMTMSTHKTLFGPQGGLVLAFEKNAEIIKKATFPGLTSSHHIHHMAAKAIAFAEALEFGKDYASQTIKNAKALAGMFVNPFTESSVEEMNSRGIGALTVQPLGDQKLEGRGYWYDGHWNVVFIRNLEATSKWDIDFSDKNQVILAFALWDGSKKEMNSNKMVSFWQALIFR